jgi:hypothetical protein
MPSARVVAPGLYGLSWGVSRLARPICRPGRAGDESLALGPASRGPGEGHAAGGSGQLQASSAKDGE